MNLLIVEIFRYLKRRADKRPVYLKNFVDQTQHHGQRTTEPSVAIIIPTRDKVELLRACVESVFEKTTYQNYSIIVVDNQSVEEQTHSYLDELAERGVSVLKYPHRFNYSAICNYAASTTTAEFFCFLNNDTEVLEPNWLGYMIDHAVQPNVGVVGSKLLYPDGSIQHLGVALGFTGVAGHAYGKEKPENCQPECTTNACYEVSSVTFACSAISASLFNSLGGLDEKFKVGLNDVAFALLAKTVGSNTVLCTASALFHHESKSRNSVHSPMGALTAFWEISLFSKKFPNYLREERFFEKNL